MKKDPCRHAVRRHSALAWTCSDKPWSRSCGRDVHGCEHGRGGWWGEVLTNEQGRCFVLRRTSRPRLRVLGRSIRCDAIREYGEQRACQAGLVSVGRLYLAAGSAIDPAGTGCCGQALLQTALLDPLESGVVERQEFDLLFRWFVGLAHRHDRGLGPRRGFTKNRERRAAVEANCPRAFLTAPAGRSSGEAGC
jgi:hypothetical protein